MCECNANSFRVLLEVTTMGQHLLKNKIKENLKLYLNNKERNDNYSRLRAYLLE